MREPQQGNPRAGGKKQSHHQSVCRAGPTLDLRTWEVSGSQESSNRVKLDGMAILVSKNDREMPNLKWVFVVIFSLFFDDIIKESCLIIL